MSISINMKTAISSLQELLISKKLSYPIYDDNINPKAYGLHVPFACKVRAQLPNYVYLEAIGIGSNKKEAKQDAAAKLLEDLIRQIEVEDVDTVSTAQDVQSKVSNPVEIPEIPVALGVASVVELLAFCNIKMLPPPSFEATGHWGPPHAPMFEHSCTVGSVTQKAISKSKKGAKQHAAGKVLQILKASYSSSVTSSRSVSPTSYSVTSTPMEVDGQPQMINNDLTYEEKTIKILNDRNFKFTEDVSTSMNRQFYHLTIHSDPTGIFGDFDRNKLYKKALDFLSLLVDFNITSYRS